MTKRPKRVSKDPIDLDKQFRRAGQRTWAARLLAALALTVGVVHLLAHAGWQPIPIGMGKQDLLIGYPVAGLVGMAALYIWGSTPSRK